MHTKDKGVSSEGAEGGGMPVPLPSQYLHADEGEEWEQKSVICGHFSFSLTENVILFLKASQNVLELMKNCERDDF